MRRSLAALVLALLLPLPAMAAERHVVKPGETLSQIAERYGVSTSRLMQLNGIKSADLIQTGTSLRLPAARPAASAASGRGTYRVKPGETLSEIAERSGISVRRLMDLNNLSRADHVEAGRLLVVPGAPATAAASSRPAAVNKAASEHVVRPGETLSGIAELYGVPVSRLVSLNAISSPDNVEAGTRLALRSPAAAAKPAAAAVKPAPAKPAAATPTAAQPAAPATAAATTPATTAAAGGPPDWRTYGPIQVDFTTWQPLGGSQVASALNNQGQQLFLAVNCTAKQINTTGEGGVWKTWAAPQADFEERLIVDAC
ncbi:LysM peptidoglycan-binding domain-containing protein [Synechococcus sp. CS-603]|uniref:LysM peptidoglycan-binding domain-containing protein n=1 Tax=Synechococcus sp. CS-603 TaxID=2847981 RepID=UPI00223B046D|nr:LysM peptidoglycan-binding domain-containing protein [Synechococcus sp. CS-603]MCT0201181.1 LysM peptidoglycan-binding domain-containing protein [Synechococcus sp. CS-603]